MLGKCSVCGNNVGFFKLNDTLCRECIAEKQLKNKSKMKRVFSFATSWMVILILVTIASIAFAFISKTPESLINAITTIMASIFILAYSFILRFLVIRRSSSVFFSLLFAFPFFAIFSVIAGVTKNGPMSLGPLALVFVCYYIIRLPNLLDQFPNSTDNQIVKI
jgi:drug/metabolite transporter (DMT)-like permease